MSQVSQTISPADRYAIRQRLKRQDNNHQIYSPAGAGTGGEDDKADGHSKIHPAAPAGVRFSNMPSPHSLCDTEEGDDDDNDSEYEPMSTTTETATDVESLLETSSSVSDSELKALQPQSLHSYGHHTWLERGVYPSPPPSFDDEDCDEDLEPKASSFTLLHSPPGTEESQLFSRLCRWLLWFSLVVSVSYLVVLYITICRTNREQYKAFIKTCPSRPNPLTGCNILPGGGGLVCPPVSILRELNNDSSNNNNESSTLLPPADQEDLELLHWSKLVVPMDHLSLAAPFVPATNNTTTSTNNLILRTPSVASFLPDIETYYHPKIPPLPLHDNDNDNQNEDNTLLLIANLHTCLAHAHYIATDRKLLHLLLSAAQVRRDYRGAQNRLHETLHRCINQKSSGNLPEMITSIDYFLIRRERPLLAKYSALANAILPMLGQYRKEIAWAARWTRMLLAIELSTSQSTQIHSLKVPTLRNTSNGLQFELDYVDDLLQLFGGQSYHENEGGRGKNVLVVGIEDAVSYIVGTGSGGLLLMGEGGVEDGEKICWDWALSWESGLGLIRGI